MASLPFFTGWFSGKNQQTFPQTFDVPSMALRVFQRKKWQVPIVAKRYMVEQKKVRPKKENIECFYKTRYIYSIIVNIHTEEYFYD